MEATTTSLRNWTTDDFLNDSEKKNLLNQFVNYNIYNRKNSIKEKNRFKPVTNGEYWEPTNDINYNSDSKVKLEFPNLGSKYATLETKTYSVKVQRWLGHVIEITENYFVAELTDLTSGGTKELGEFDLSQISPEDKSLLKIGAAFYWHVGSIMQNGQAKTDSLIRFQRVVEWTSNELDEILSQAELMYQKLNS